MTWVETDKLVTTSSAAELQEQASALPSIVDPATSIAYLQYSSAEGGAPVYTMISHANLYRSSMLQQQLHRRAAADSAPLVYVGYISQRNHLVSGVSQQHRSPLVEAALTDDIS